MNIFNQYSNYNFLLGSCYPEEEFGPVTVRQYDVWQLDFPLVAHFSSAIVLPVYKNAPAPNLTIPSFAINHIGLLPNLMN
jgi:hypothetical protein